MTAARNTAKNTPNQPNGEEKLSKALLRMPVCADAMTACTESGSAVLVALKVSMTDAILPMLRRVVREDASRRNQCRGGTAALRRERRDGTRRLLCCALFNVRSYRLRMSAIPRSCMVLGKLRFLFSSLSLSLSLSFCLFVFRRDLSSEFPPDRPNARVKRVTMER